jgi:hypothetical protein
MPVNSAFLHDQLQYVQNAVVEQDFPDKLMGSGALVDISTEIPVGADTYTYKILTYLGEAAILGNGANDIPMVNAYVEKRVGQVRTIADKYEVTVEDLEHSQMAGMNIDTSMGIGAREIIETKFDLLGYDGDPNYNLLGVITLPNIPEYTVANDGTGSTTEFANKTPAQIYRDLSEFISETKIASKYVFNPQWLWLPPAQYELVMTTPYSDNNTASDTIGSLLMKTQADMLNGIQGILPVPYLEGKGTGGTDLMLTHIKRPDLIQFHMPLGFEQRPRSQEMDLAFEVVCRLKTGGVENKKPLSLRKAEGI